MPQRRAPYGEQREDPVLSDAERDKLLWACKASRWPLLYVLVLMALTTGARKGELLGLRWGDVDLERREALHLKRSSSARQSARPKRKR